MDATLLFYIAILIMSVVIHEFSHGVAAYLQGDKTAQYAGRLTLNPIPHIDPFGSILLPFLSVVLGGFFIGWAKPVPYNPYNLRDQKWGPALVGLAGPASNIIIALLFGFLLRGVSMFEIALPSAFLGAAYMITRVNVWLAVLNLMPLPPLDGSKLLYVFFPRQSYKLDAFFGTYGLLLIFPVLFVLMPIMGIMSDFLLDLIVGS